jgi:hypothetical protein
MQESEAAFQHLTGYLAHLRALMLHIDIRLHLLTTQEAFRAFKSSCEFNDIAPEIQFEGFRHFEQTLAATAAHIQDQEDRLVAANTLIEFTMRDTRPVMTRTPPAWYSTDDNE